MRKLFSLITLFIIVIFLSSCQDDKNIPVVESTNQNNVFEGPQNPDQNGNIPAATVELQHFEPKPTPLSPTSTPTLTPESLVATLRPGESVSESKSLFLPASITPPKADVLICFDLTGSMGEELNNVKTNSVNIINAVRTDIPDSYFGVVSHMDYPGFFSGCGYSSTYGFSGIDYAYRLDQSITSEITNVQSAINSLVLGNGADFAENYTRAFYETYADPNIGFRPGSKKIVLAFLDALPHDCAIVLGANTYTTGPDPGRDGIAGNSDDLVMNNVLDQMAANNITLIPIYSGFGSAGGVDYFNAWIAYAARTGSEAFRINTDGTIPGGINIEDFIKSIVSGSITRFNSVNLEVCDPAFSSWLTASSPSAYSNVELGTDQTLGFDITLTVPAGTPDGIYEFDVCAVGDGVELARQSVRITVQAGEVSENCPLSQGYWSAHPNEWPTSATPMLLGSVNYSKTQLLTILNTSIRNDASLILAYQLIAAKLNVANGSPIPTTVQDAISNADNAIGSNTIPMSVRLNSPLGQTMTSLAKILDDYNNNLLTPECGY